LHHRAGSSSFTGQAGRARGPHLDFVLPLAGLTRSAPEFATDWPEKPCQILSVIAVGAGL